jgi:proteasome lid subunit RPN8/RPN11
VEVGPSVAPLERIYKLAIPREIAQEILEHVEREYPIEACGALFGRVESGSALVEKVVPLRNVLGSSTAFWFDERDWMSAIMSAKREGLEYIGLYHSHAREQPLPSLADRHRMLECPGEVWLIVAYRPGGEPRLAAYRIDDYGSAVMRVRVELL